MADRRPALDEIPLDRHYDTGRHLWALRDEASGHVRVGVDALALESLGALAHVALAPLGAALAQDELLGTLEAAKMTTSLVAPVSGTVSARNEAAIVDPGLINRSPYADGWLVELRCVDWEAEAGRLLSGPAAREWAAEQAARLEAD